MYLVYLDKIKKNIEEIRKHSSNDIIGVVKSNAYGLDCKVIVPFLKSIGIKYFFVNHLYEYIQFEKEFRSSYVIIMDSLKCAKLEYDNIIYTVNSIDDAKNLAKSKKRIKVHIQVDTCINRLGLRSISDLKEVINILSNNTNIDIEGIYTHLSYDEDDFTNHNNTINKFSQYVLLYPFNIIHCNATPSIHKKNIGNMVRVGIGMYGFGNNYLNLVNSLSIKMKFTNILNLSKDDYVGYRCNNAKLDNSKRIGLLNVGYYEYNEINDVYLKQNNSFIKISKIGKSCMNHSHYILNDKINYSSFVSFCRKDGIINNSKINYYRELIKLSNYHKGYILKGDYYDLLKTIKERTKKGKRIRIRRRSNKDISS